MAGSTNSTKIKGAFIRQHNGENPGVKGASSTPSGQGINRRALQPTVAQLQTLQELKFEAATKGAKGSSSTPSSVAAQRANVRKGGLR